jgi:hypothetical protein
VTEWGNAPWTLRGYVVWSLATQLILAILGTGTPVVLSIASFALQAIICFLLLRRERWVWILILALTLLSLADTAIAVPLIGGSVRWYIIPLSLIDLFLLLHPATRRFFRREETSGAVASG